MQLLPHVCWPMVGLLFPTAKIPGGAQTSVCSAPWSAGTFKLLQTVGYCKNTKYFFGKLNLISNITYTCLIIFPPFLKPKLVVYCTFIQGIICRKLIIAVTVKLRCVPKLLPTCLKLGLPPTIILSLQINSWLLSMWERLSGVLGQRICFISYKTFNAKLLKLWLGLVL